MCPVLDLEKGGVWVKDRERTTEVLEVRRSKKMFTLATPYQKRGEFQNWRDVCFQGFFLEGRFREENNSELFIETNEELKKKFSKRRRYFKKKGKVYERTRMDKTPVYELNCDLSTGLATILHEAAVNPLIVKAVSLSAISKADKFLRDLTKSNDGASSWRPISGACHPDSEDKLSFHFNIVTVDDNNVSVGRSANGGKGRVGLRRIGPAFLNVLRNAEYVSVPDELLDRPKNSLEKLKDKKADDIELAAFMEEAVIESMEEVGLKVDRNRIRDLNQKHASGWLKNILIQSDIAKVEGMRTNIEGLEEKVEHFRAIFQSNTQDPAKLQKELDEAKKDISVFVKLVNDVKKTSKEFKLGIAKKMGKKSLIEGLEKHFPDVKNDINLDVEKILR